MKCEICNVVLVPHVDDDCSCSCHLCAPCAKCTDDREECPKCGEIYSPEYVPLEKSTYDRPLPRCPIDAGIDYTVTRAGGWVQVRGTKREGLTTDMVKDRLGNFDKYHMFKFKLWGANTFSASWCSD